MAAQSGWRVCRDLRWVRARGFTQFNVLVAALDVLLIRYIVVVARSWRAGACADFDFFAKCFVRRKGLFEDCNQ